MTIQNLLLSLLPTIIMLFVGYKVNSFLKKKDRDDRVRFAKQEVYYLKLEAILFTLGMIGTDDHKKEFKQYYEDRYNELLKDRHNISTVADEL